MLLPIISLLAALPAAAAAQPESHALLSYTLSRSEPVHWASQPAPEAIAATPAAQIPGGARAAFKCTVNQDGAVMGCAIEALEPALPEVKSSALSLLSYYHLDAAGTEKARHSQTPPVVWLQISFPDKNGAVPGGCNPAFGCIIDHMPSPLPPAPFELPTR